MEPNDAVLVLVGGSVPVGARVLQAPAEGRVWLDTCTMGQHLPQMYRIFETSPLDAEVATAHGLCRDCLGYGSTELVTLLAAGVDQVEHPCGTCHGSGRPALRVHVERSPGGVVGRLEVAPHDPVPGRHVCLACGMDH